jgi:hypothetical protein
MLSPFELLVMSLFKALTDPSYVPDLSQSPAYFNDVEDSNDDKKRRFDKHRLLVIAMVNFMAELLDR